MTHPEHTPASPAQKRVLPVPEDVRDERARRARAERMAVTAFGSSLYEVESASDNTYLVDLGAGRCTCPDHVVRGVRCKHLRRVAIEITERLVPPPGHVAGECAHCGEVAFVRADADGPHFCRDHRLAVGDRATDRETGHAVVVTALSDRSADAVTVPGTGQTVAEYETNADYPDDDPVVAAVYVDDLSVGADGPSREELQVYVFPHTRLERVDGR